MRGIRSILQHLECLPRSPPPLLQGSLSIHCQPYNPGSVRRTEVDIKGKQCIVSWLVSDIWGDLAGKLYPQKDLRSIKWTTGPISKTQRILTRDIGVHIVYMHTHAHTLRAGTAERERSGKGDTAKPSHNSCWAQGQESRRSVPRGPVLELQAFPGRGTASLSILTNAIHPSHLLHAAYPHLCRIFAKAKSNLPEMPGKSKHLI